LLIVPAVRLVGALWVLSAAVLSRAAYLSLVPVWHTGMG
jgi:hypothetical protein